jgi:hypothetical protein
MRTLRFWQVAVLAILFAFASCDQSRRQIVGKWKVVGGSSDVVWDFAANGAVTTPGAPGRYSFGDNNRLKIETGSATFVHQMEFVGDHMIWKDLNGTKTELERVK